MTSHASPGAACLAVVALALVASCAKPIPQPPAATPAPADAVPEGQLPEGVQPTRYEIALTLIPGEPTFAGTATIEIVLDAPLSGIWMHGEDLDVSSVVVRHGAADVPATWTQRTSDGVARVEFAEAVPAGASTLVIAFEGRTDHPLRGIYEVTSGDRQYLFTQFESISARLAFPSFDEPRFKTPFLLTLTVPTELFAAANTPVDEVADLEGGLRQIRFMETPPLPTYLIALAVGPLDVSAGPSVPPNAIRSVPVPLGGIAAFDRGEGLSYALERTGSYVEALEAYFAIPYPYRKLDLVAVPDFGAGAMENVGLITFREWLLLVDPKTATEGQRRAFAYVTAHELAHQWFGNLVTMPWWNDIWLNEAFATWMGNKIVAELHPDYSVELSSLASAQRAMQLDSLTSARQIRQPIVDNHDIQNAFDPITYQKGGAVLEMFERWMGAERFRDGIRLYLRTHEESTATAEDLLAALDEVDPRDVTEPFQSFLNQPGVPLLHASLECPDGPDAPGFLDLAQERYLPLGSPGDAACTWQIPLCVRTSSGATCSMLESERGRVSLADCPTWWMLNDDGAGYFRFALSEQDWSALRETAFPELSPRGQMAVADSLLAAFDQGKVDAASLEPWLPVLAKSRVREIATAPMRPLRFMMEEVAPPDIRPDVQARAGSLYRARYETLGWRSRPKDSSDTKLLRESVIRFMVMDIRDPAARKRAARLGRAEVGYPVGSTRRAVEPQLADVALAAAVQESGPEFFDHLVAQLESSDDATERTRILGALGHAEDPELARRARDLSLTPTTRVNEVARVLGPQFGNPRTRDASWIWLTANFDALSERFGQRQLGGTPWYGASFCTADEAATVLAFFEPRVAELTGGPRNLEGAVERVRLCAALSEAQRPSVIETYGP